MCGRRSLLDASDVRNYDVQNLVAIGRLSQRCGNGACSGIGGASRAHRHAQTRNIPVNDQPNRPIQLVSMVDSGGELSGGPSSFFWARRRLRARDRGSEPSPSLLIGRVRARESASLRCDRALGATRGASRDSSLTETLVLCLLGLGVGLTLAIVGNEESLLLLVPGTLPEAR